MSSSSLPSSLAQLLRRSGQNLEECRSSVEGGCKQSSEEVIKLTPFMNKKIDWVSK